MTFIHLQRRPFLLLEVLIAMALIALCAIPLIGPQAWLAKQEKELYLEVEKGNQVHHLYAEVIRGFFRNDFNWGEIIEEKRIKVNDTGSFIPKILKSKQGAKNDELYHLIALKLFPTSMNENEDSPFNYLLFVESKGLNTPVNLDVEELYEEE